MKNVLLCVSLFLSLQTNLTDGSEAIAQKHDAAAMNKQLEGMWVIESYQKNGQTPELATDGKVDTFCPEIGELITFGIPKGPKRKDDPLYEYPGSYGRYRVGVVQDADDDVNISLRNEAQVNNGIYSTSNLMWCIKAIVRRGNEKLLIIHGLTHADKRTVLRRARPTIKLSTDTADEFLYPEVLETIKGVEKSFSVSQELTHEVMRSKTTRRANTVGGQIGSTSLVSLSADHTSEISKAVGVTIGKKEKFSQKITLNGEDTVKVEVRWYKRYRTGSIHTPTGQVVPFKVSLGLRTKLRRLK